MQITEATQQPLPTGSTEDENSGPEGGVLTGGQPEDATPSRWMMASTRGCLETVRDDRLGSERAKMSGERMMLIETAIQRQECAWIGCN